MLFRSSGVPVQVPWTGVSSGDSGEAALPLEAPIDRQRQTAAQTPMPETTLEGTFRVQVVCSSVIAGRLPGFRSRPVMGGEYPGGLRLFAKNTRGWTD